MIFSRRVVPTRELPFIRDQLSPRPPIDLCAISFQDQDLLHSASKNEYLRLVLADDAKLLARFAEEIILNSGIANIIMNWHERIVADPEVLAGKPVIRGTRMAVEFVLDLLANGWSEGDVLKNYPRLTPKDIQACIGYASALLKSEKVYPIKVLQEGI